MIDWTVPIENWSQLSDCVYNMLELCAPVILFLWSAYTLTRFFKRVTSFI